MMKNLEKRTEIEVEAAAFRRLLTHLRQRSDVENTELMTLAGFCRQCISNWYREEATGLGVALSLDEARERVYGMPYEDWKLRYEA